MPSEHQHATEGAPTTRLSEELGEPPGILDRGLDLFEARLRGIDDEDLLLAYIEVETDHKSRSEVVALVQQRLDEVREAESS